MYVYFTTHIKCILNLKIINIIYYSSGSLKKYMLICCVLMSKKKIECIIVGLLSLICLGPRKILHRHRL